ncbi:substrate-binding domain-containing protein [Laribacter hongkongensis]|nr:substrate-binding domain-containing protein [Laribacter hongkongensis]
MGWKKRGWLVIGVLCGLVACSESIPRVDNRSHSAFSQSAGQNTSPARIVLVMKSPTNPYFSELANGASRAQLETSIDLSIKVAHEDDALEQQIRLIDEVIAKHQADAIVIAPTDSIRLVPVLARARKAGIHVINIGNRLEPRIVALYGMPVVPLISIDNASAAYQVAGKLAEGLPRGSKVAIIEGLLGTNNTRQRTEGALQAFSEAGLRVVAKQSARWKGDEAYQVTAQLLRDYPDLRAIFCSNDMMALGAARYLREKGITGVRLAGFDGITEARSALHQRQLVATIDQHASEQGYLAVRLAVDAIAGRPLAEETLVDTELLTATATPSP